MATLICECGIGCDNFCWNERQHPIPMIKHYKRDTCFWPCLVVVALIIECNFLNAYDYQNLSTPGEKVFSGNVISERNVRYFSHQVSLW